MQARPVVGCLFLFGYEVDPLSIIDSCITIGDLCVELLVPRGATLNRRFFAVASGLSSISYAEDSRHRRMQIKKLQHV
jgi:hypothetical protein